MMVKHAPIKGLMFSSDGGEKLIGSKILARHTGDPNGNVRQCSIKSREAFVCDEASRVDDDLSSRKLGLQIVGKNLE
jgi:hypothetical protein